MSYLDFLRLAIPETIVVVAALAVLGVDLVVLRGVETRLRLLIGTMISCVGCLGGVAWLLAFPQTGNFMHGMLVANPLTRIVMIALLLLTIATLLLSLETRFTPHIGEFFALVLLGTVGMLFLVSTEDILMIFVSLELTSLSLYILTAFDKSSVKSSEAALKYFLFGGMAAAFTLFGLSLLYGIAHSTNLGQIAQAIAQKATHASAGAGASHLTLDPVLILAIVLTVAGFGFKLATVPFHLWAPDAYQGAPIPSAALIASGSKLAGFFILAKVMFLGFAGAEGTVAWRAFLPGWVPLLAVIAAASMVLGNLAALVQGSVRRLIAYSAIAHSGYMLIALLSHQVEAMAPLLYYVMTYGLTTLGAFGVVGVVQERAGGDRLADFAGLGRSAPLLSFCMLIFMLSLAGIPPLAGFFGKFYLFSFALSAPGSGLGLLWLVSLAIGMSAVSLYYYLQVLKQIYVVPTAASGTSVKTPVSTQTVLVLLALAVLVLGCVPGLVLIPILSALRL